MGQIKWFDRKFEFDEKQNIFPSILERLSGTPIRLEVKLKSIDPAFYDQRIIDAWTIKENAGHLGDLEPLWQGRLEDIINGALEMRPADLQNTRTTLANHNSKTIDELIHSFTQIRLKTIHLLRQIGEEAIFKSSLHPRLKTPMRTMDLFLFVAEHDDHHLARITELVKLIERKNKNSVGTNS